MMVARRKGTFPWPLRDPFMTPLPVSMVCATSFSIPVWSQEGSVLNMSPPPEEASQEQEDRKDLLQGARFELSPMLLETDR